MKKLTSRKFWVMALGIVVMSVNQTFGIDLNVDSLVGIGAVLIAFITGQSLVDINGIGQYAAFVEKLKSKKLWTALVVSILVGLNDALMWGISPDNINLIVGIAVTFILGRSAVSMAQAKKRSEPVDQLNIPIEPPV